MNEELILKKLTRLERRLDQVEGVVESHGEGLEILDQRDENYERLLLRLANKAGIGSVIELHLLKDPASGLLRPFALPKDDPAIADNVEMELAKLKLQDEAAYQLALHFLGFFRKLAEAKDARLKARLAAAQRAAEKTKARPASAKSAYDAAIRAINTGDFSK